MAADGRRPSAGCFPTDATPIYFYKRFHAQQPLLKWNEIN